MSLCRRSLRSDLYIYERSGDPLDSFRCEDCFLLTEGQPDPIFTTEQELYQHLLDHKAANHKVPRSLIQDLAEYLGLAQPPIAQFINRFREPPLETPYSAIIRYMEYLSLQAYQQDQEELLLLEWLKSL